MIFKTDSQVKVGAEEDTGLYHMERSVQQTNQVLNTSSFIFDQCPLHASKNLERRKQLILQDCHMPRQMTAGVRQWGGGVADDGGRAHSTPPTSSDNSE